MILLHRCFYLYNIISESIVNRGHFWTEQLCELEEILEDTLECKEAKRMKAESKSEQRRNMGMEWLQI